MDAADGTDCSTCFVFVLMFILFVSDFLFYVGGRS
jgi:hypothetical protein